MISPAPNGRPVLIAEARCAMGEWLGPESPARRIEQSHRKDVNYMSNLCITEPSLTETLLLCYEDVRDRICWILTHRTGLDVT